jgi:hypothetical protein
MKKLFALFVLILLIACAEEAPPQPKPQPVIPEIEIITPQKELPEKPEYEPPPTEPVEEQIAPAVQPPPLGPLREFTIEANDYGFYPSGDITVNKGEQVKITFKVRTDGVYYGGLQMKSDMENIFDTGTLKPGEIKTVEFVAERSFTYSSWWPAQARKKKTATVTVT